MELILVGLCLYLLVGVAVAEYVGSRNNGYLYVVLLWGVMVPVSAYKSFTEEEDEEE